ncbi:MAG: bifunctional adenosylcobinamide kinase/adenosylcobinamide-phosphate guanylyltransferase [Phormidesmis sp.]
MTITLVTGPARSGKSEWAEGLAQQKAAQKRQQVVYIATARKNPGDAEWQARIAKHRQRRPAQWQCQEVPVNLAAAIAHHNHTHCLLVDSLGTWLANLIEQEAETWEIAQQQLITALNQTTAEVILVAEETGWGVVPDYELGRTFRDRLGSLSRAVGAISTDVYLTTGGYAINLAELGQLIV